MSKCINCGLAFAIYGRKDAEFCSKKCENEYNFECCNNCKFLDITSEGNQCLRNGNIINWNITKEHNLSSCFIEKQ